MTFSQFLTILRARRKLALLVLLSTVLAVVALSLILPKKYTATASVVVDVKTPDPITGTAVQGMALGGYMASQVDVLVSPRVAQRVIGKLRLTQVPELRTQWEEETNGKGKFEEWVADLLLLQLEVKPARESNVMYVTYKSPSPEFAQALANAFAEAYVDTTLELRTQPARAYNKFFDEQSKQKREALEAAQTKLSVFQRERGLLVTDERLDVETAKLNEMSSQLVALQALASESGSRSNQAARAGSQMQEVTSNPVVSQLKTQLAAERAKLSDIRQRFGEAHPQVKQQVAIIEELKGRISDETKTLTSGVNVNNTVNQQRLRDIKTGIEQQRAKVLKMKGDRDEALVLQRDIENAQQAYAALVNRLNQSTLESQTQQSNVSVLSAAPLPLIPSSPKVILNTVLSVVLGTLLGIGLALLRELFDRRVRTPADVLDVVDLRVIGHMPPPGLPQPKRKLTALASSKKQTRLNAPKLQPGSAKSA